MAAAREDEIAIHCPTPQELEAAAIIDGTSYWNTLPYIYLPLSVPALATLILFASVTHWNNWFDGMILIMDNTKYPVATLPILIVYPFLQRYFIHGIRLGAVKG